VRVIVRTARGLETGEVLAPCDAPVERGMGDGAILRGMTVEDQLLEARLEKNRDRAFAACQQRLEELGIDATLLDVEHLFDGRQLYFYFLGEVTPAIEAVTQELAEVYDSQAQFRQFADTLTAGCGPGCGTADASGAGCASCAVGCAITEACTTRRRSA
jgi:cell fate regulator YaaT (PSP1 superfamily)